MQPQSIESVMRSTHTAHGSTGEKREYREYRSQFKQEIVIPTGLKLHNMRRDRLVNATRVKRKYEKVTTDILGTKKQN